MTVTGTAGTAGPSGTGPLWARGVLCHLHGANVGRSSKARLEQTWGLSKSFKPGSSQPGQLAVKTSPGQLPAPPPSPRHFRGKLFAPHFWKLSQPSVTGQSCDNVNYPSTTPQNPPKHLETPPKATLTSQTPELGYKSGFFATALGVRAGKRCWEGSLGAPLLLLLLGHGVGDEG